MPQKMFKWTKPPWDLMRTLAPSKQSIQTRLCSTLTRVQLLPTHSQKSTRKIRQLPSNPRKRRPRPHLPLLRLFMNRFCPKRSKRTQTQPTDYLSPSWNLTKPIPNKISKHPRKKLQVTPVWSSSSGNKRIRTWSKKSAMRRMNRRTKKLKRWKRNRKIRFRDSSSSNYRPLFWRMPADHLFIIIYLSKCK